MSEERCPDCGGGGVARFGPDDGLDVTWFVRCTICKKSTHSDYISQDAAWDEWRLRNEAKAERDLLLARATAAEARVGELEAQETVSRRFAVDDGALIAQLRARLAALEQMVEKAYCAGYVRAAGEFQHGLSREHHEAFAPGVWLSSTTRAELEKAREGSK